MLKITYLVDSLVKFLISIQLILVVNQIPNSNVYCISVLHFHRDLSKMTVDYYLYLRICVVPYYDPLIIEDKSI